VPTDDVGARPEARTVAVAVTDADPKAAPLAIPDAEMNCVNATCGVPSAAVDAIPWAEIVAVA
jgi:hypothetical protein